MARPECRRCGSDLVVAGLSGSPSEWVEELRGGYVRARVVADGGVNWLCRSCGHRWDSNADLAPELEHEEVVASVEPTESHPGALLRRVREEQGHTLAEAVSGTRIPEPNLRALEGDAPLEEFPAPPYARFFLREYAEFLQLRPEPLLQEFDARHPAVEEPALEPLPQPRDRRDLAAGVMAVVAVAALIVIALLRSVPPPAAEPSEGIGTAVRVHDSGRAPPPPSAPERRGVRAVLQVRQPCWVRVSADGEVVASRTLLPGEPVVFRARRDLRLTLGNAGGVKLLVNDEPVQTGSPGEVVVLSLSWRHGAVRIERA